MLWRVVSECGKSSYDARNGSFVSSVDGTWLTDIGIHLEQSS